MLSLVLFLEIVGAADAITAVAVAIAADVAVAIDTAFYAAATIFLVV